MDFVCQLDTGEYALVEAQIISQNYWDKRALAYIAAFYGNQLKKGQDWTQIKRVIGFNILGCGKENLQHWKETPHQFMRHYMFEEQIHKEPRFIQDLQLFQYSIQNEPKGELTQEQKDWITFLKRSHSMTEDQVALIQTEAVRKAFERSRFNRMSQFQREAYEKQDMQYSQFSDFTEEKVQEGREEGIEIGALNERRKIALKMLSKQKIDEEILELSELTPDELAELKESIQE